MRGLKVGKGPALTRNAFSGKCRGKINLSEGNQRSNFFSFFLSIYGCLISSFSAWKFVAAFNEHSLFVYVVVLARR